MNSSRRGAVYGFKLESLSKVCNVANPSTITILRGQAKAEAVSKTGQFK